MWSIWHGMISLCLLVLSFQWLNNPLKISGKGCVWQNLTLYKHHFALLANLVGLNIRAFVLQPLSHNYFWPAKEKFKGDFKWIILPFTGPSLTNLFLDLFLPLYILTMGNSEPFKLTRPSISLVFGVGGIFGRETNNL